MIAGIGIDILRADRIRSAIERYGERFTGRVFTCAELEYCRSKKNAYESLAARFAVKEAAFKALGRGWDECGGFTAVEVVTGNGGSPEIVFRGKARQIADSLDVSRAFVTITHDGGISAAIVILEKQV